jgi:uncharacterized membrane protein HdeD (DUF308 family)
MSIRGGNSVVEDMTGMTQLWRKVIPMPLVAQWIMPAPDPVPIVVGALCLLGGPAVIMAVAFALLAHSRWKAWRELQIVALGCAIAFVAPVAAQVRFQSLPASVIVTLIGLGIVAAGLVGLIRAARTPPS